MLPLKMRVFQYVAQKGVEVNADDVLVGLASEYQGERQFNRKRKPVKFRYFHPHTIRHTFATRCFENGIEPKVAQKLLGHSSITVTMNIYTHVMEDKMGDEISKFGFALTDTEAKDYKELLGDVKQISVHSNL